MCLAFVELLLLVLFEKEKQSFENALSCIIGVPSGSKLDEIMNAFSQNGYNDRDDLWDVEKEELRSFGLKNLHLLRWRIYNTHERIYLVVVIFNSKQILCVSENNFPETNKLNFF